MMYPKKKWSDPPKSDIPNVPEAALQTFMDDLLEYKHIRSIRIPDGIFRWVQVNASQGFRAWFNKVFAGFPDNLLLIPTGQGYMKAFPIELKTATGKLHGKQKTRAKEQGWKVCRSTTEIVVAVDEAERVAKE
jgi:hypothetical protein